MSKSNGSVDRIENKVVVVKMDNGKTIFTDLNNCPSVSEGDRVRARKALRGIYRIEKVSEDTIAARKKINQLENDLWEVERGRYDEK